MDTRQSAQEAKPSAEPDRDIRRQTPEEGIVAEPNGFAAEHHTFKHVGFGGSVGRMVLDVEVDDDQLFWDVNHQFRGVMAYVAVYF